ncbi:ABC transporter ATP-binding protein [Geomicrobium halophilum]|nr:ABC transporter ATP-binding protein [Geomicrobium halophilum]
MSFKLERGKIYGFLGPNGSGKTTTIRMIGTLVAADHGEITINGYNTKTNREKALKNLGAIVENPGLFEYLSGEQNLKQFANLGVDAIDQSRINEVVKLVDLEHAIHKKVKAYSLGMKQRLGIAVSILHHPSVLILDEPTNGLDPNGIRQLRNDLQKLAKEDGVTLLVSSHQLSEVEILCDRAIVIKEGSVMGELDMHMTGKNKDELTVVIEAEPKAEAISVLSSFGEVMDTDQYLELTSQTYNTLPKITRALANANISVYAFSYKRRLEDAYFSLTREKGGIK